MERAGESNGFVNQSISFYFSYFSGVQWCIWVRFGVYVLWPYANNQGLLKIVVAYLFPIYDLNFSLITALNLK